MIRIIRYLQLIILVLYKKLVLYFCAVLNSAIFVFLSEKLNN